ncbi:MAG: formylglycine-generating enzyme family protein [Pirellulales bacterium]
MRFRLIPPGEFTMGMTKEEAEAVAALNPNDESWKRWSLSSSPAHRVRLTQAYYLGTYEVTQEQYERVVGVNPSYFSATGEGQELVKDEDPRQHPVETVSFLDAVEFCIKLSKQEILKPVYSSANNAYTLIPGDGYRLPTEAEWEYACRAGTNTAWFHGEQESELGTVAWFGGNSGGRTHAVRQLKANPFGLYDVHGNVWEWCQDWHDAQAYSQRGPGPTEDPQGPDGRSAHVLRGGHWYNNFANCRSAFRASAGVGYRNPNAGFRVLLGVSVSRSSR